MASLSASDSYETSDVYYSERTFQHSQKPLPDNGAINLCRYFMQGYCSRGDRCHYAHVTNLAQVQGRNQSQSNAYNHHYTSTPSQQYQYCSLKYTGTRSRKSTSEEESNYEN